MQSANTSKVVIISASRGKRPTEFETHARRDIMMQKTEAITFASRFSVVKSADSGLDNKLSFPIKINLSDTK
jgi:hypothetical protein